MKITREDLRLATSEGVLSSESSQDLWHWLENHNKHKPKFDLVHIAYYAGALIVIGAMSVFMGLAWERFGSFILSLIAAIYALGFLAVGHKLWGQERYHVLGGLLLTVSLCMTPLFVYGIQSGLGLWGGKDPGDYRDFYKWIKEGWLVMDLMVIVVGLLLVRKYRFPFLTMPIALALWFISMDLTPLVFGTEDFTWDMRKQVSMGFGLVMLLATFLVERRGHKDLVFWGYLYGLLAFWCSLSLLDSHDELGKFVYFLINLTLVGISVYLKRRTFLVFGAFGIAGYLGHLAYDVFEDSMLFPFALSLIGIGVLAGGVFIEKRTRLRIAS